MRQVLGENGGSAKVTFLKVKQLMNAEMKGFLLPALMDLECIAA